MPDGSTLLINTDITNFRQHEDELHRSKEAAERESRFKSEFLAKLSHELRTPLNAIIGFSQIMKDELFGPLGKPRYQHYAIDILASARLLLSLISDVLDLSKIEAGKYELHKEELDVCAVAREMARLVKGEVDEKNLYLKLSLENDLPHVFADERAVRQILLNLVSNSIKFTPVGGYICIEALQNPGGSIRVAVSDNGIGIPKEKIETILDPFVQANVNDHADIGGAGLGLAIVNSLVLLHGGTIEVESEFGDGTRVTVDLP